MAILAQMAEFLPYPQMPTMDDRRRILAAEKFAATMVRRRSCRDFADTPVPRAVIEAAIRAAGSAPSGANHQPWHFAAVSSPEVKRRIREEAEASERAFYAGDGGEEWLNALAPLGTNWEKPYLETAPWVIVVFAQRRGGVDVGDSGRNYYVTESCSIACGMLIATLQEAGLATLTHTPTPMGFLRAICDRPMDEKPLMMIVVGHPSVDATVPSRGTSKKPLEAISSWL